MDCKQELLQVLAMAGSDGLSLKKIVKHVYNSKVSFFESPNYEKLYNDIAQFLSKEVKYKHGMVRRIGTRGVYVINESWVGYMHKKMDLSFADETKVDAEKNGGKKELKQPSLFDGLC